MSKSGAAARYALALFELAQEANALDAVEEGMSRLEEALKVSDDFARVAQSPLVPADEKSAALSAVAKVVGAPELAQRFVAVLAENRRGSELGRTITEFKALCADARGALRATATVAADLGEAEIKRLTDALKESLGREVEIDVNVDPSILSGLRVQVGSTLVDASLRSKLDALKSTMTKGA